MLKCQAKGIIKELTATKRIGYNFCESKNSIVEVKDINDLTEIIYQWVIFHPEYKSQDDNNINELQWVISFHKNGIKACFVIVSTKMCCAIVKGSNINIQHMSFVLRDSELDTHNKNTNNDKIKVISYQVPSSQLDSFDTCPL